MLSLFWGFRLTIWNVNPIKAPAVVASLAKF